MGIENNLINLRKDCTYAYFIPKYQENPRAQIHDQTTPY